MKTKLLLTLFFSGFFSIICFGQQPSQWDKWTPLIGEWQGQGSGKPGQGGGKFTFQFDLDKKVLVRKSHSEYPATKDKPKIVHKDLMVIYPDFTGNPAKAIYFDNEGHVINYTITISDKLIVMTSEKLTNSPIFRLSYSFPDPKMMHTKFEMSPDGEKFIPYIEGNSIKIK